MSTSPTRSLVLTLALLFCFGAFESANSGAQTLPNNPGVSPAYPLAKVPSSEEQHALETLTSAQMQSIQTYITPKLQRIVATQQPSTAANYRSWKDIIHNGTSAAQVMGQTTQDSAAVSMQVNFISNSGNHLTSAAKTRVYHPIKSKSESSNTVLPAWTLPPIHPPGGGPVQPPPDQDGDGLPDCCDGLETQLAYEFEPVDSISSGEQQQFALFADSVPWTVTGLVGTSPVKSYTHVSPLGLTTDQNGNQIYAIRVDYLSLWNADGGLIGGGGGCFYSLFGLDGVIQDLSGHSLDAERSVMLLGAPPVNGSYNPNPSAYSLYSIYTAAHEGTFFDESEYADFTTPVPAGNHINLAQSLSKHSTYSFNPDYSPITPAWFIASTMDSINASYDDGEIDDVTYLALIAAADDTFYGCLVERFGDQGPDPIPYPVANVGEVAHPLPGYTFIQDNSSQALNLASKIANPVF